MDSDGFIKTGDVAILDDDGYVEIIKFSLQVSIVGRKKDVIIRGGENVYPKEIEDHLIKMPNVETVQVVGCKDETLGEEIVALIKMMDGHAPLTNTFVFEHCHKKIAHYKIPKQYITFALIISALNIVMISLRPSQESPRSTKCKFLSILN